MSIIKHFSKHANKTKRVELERYRIIKFLGIIIFLFFFVCFKKVFLLVHCNYFFIYFDSQ